MSYFGNLQKIKVGLANEYIAAAWLTKENYTVYWKTQDNDVIDLVAVHRITGEVLKIDVKTWKPGTVIGRNLSKYQKQLGVKILYVFKNGSCKFKPDKRNDKKT